MRSSNQQVIIQQLENAIWDIAKQYKGNGAFYFYNESDVQCRLYSCIQKNVKNKKIVHAEWRCNNPSGWYDLAIWTPQKAKEAINYWGKDTTFILSKIPRLVLAAIEIECLYGGSGKANYFTSYKLLEENPDIQKLINGIGSSCTYGYYLMFWDDEAVSSYSKIAQKIENKFKGLENKYKLRSICISREKIVFSHGFITKSKL
jgi:hypothetical protein